MSQESLLNTELDSERSLEDSAEQGLAIKLLEARTNCNVRKILNCTRINKPLGANYELRKTWAAKPQTISALAFAYLTEVSLEKPELVKPYLLKLSKRILENIHSGTPDLRDYSMLLLYTTLEEDNNAFVQKLVERNIIELLVPLMSHNQRPLRILAAAICCKLYKGKTKVQRLFIKAGGHEQLLHLLKTESSDKVISEILEHIIELSIVNST